MKQLWMYGLLAASTVFIGCAQDQPVAANGGQPAHPFNWAYHTYSGHGAVLVARRNIDMSNHLLITPKAVIDLGLHRNPKLETQERSEEASLLRLSYRTGSGTGVEHRHETVILLRDHETPLMADVYAGGYVDQSWRLDGPTGNRFAQIEWIDDDGDQITVHYVYGIEEGEDHRCSQTVQLQPHPIESTLNREVMAFMGYTLDED